jgi:hypothetical protein
MTDHQKPPIDSEAWTGSVTSDPNLRNFFQRKPDRILYVFAALATAIWISGISISPLSTLSNIAVGLGGILIQSSIIVLLFRWVDSARRKIRYEKDIIFIRYLARKNYLSMCNSISHTTKYAIKLINNPDEREKNEYILNQIADFKIHIRCSEIISAFRGALDTNRELNGAIVGIMIISRDWEDSLRYINQLDHFSLRYGSDRDFDEKLRVISSRVIAYLDTIESAINALIELDEPTLPKGRSYDVFENFDKLRSALLERENS